MSPISIWSLYFGNGICDLEYSPKYHSANEMGMYKLFIPIFGSVLSVLILGESFTRNLFVGLVLVIIGSLVLNVDIRKYRKN